MAQTPAPNLGRSVKIVAPVENVYGRDTPHTKVGRGEVTKALLTLRNNRSSRDPLKRVVQNNAGEDKRNTLSVTLGKLPDGKMNNEQMAIDSAATTEHIKKVARAFGADIVGVGAAHPAYFHAGGIDAYGGEARSRDIPVDHDPANDPEELARRFPFFIVTPVAIDYDLNQAHRHIIGDIAYGIAEQKLTMVRTSLMRYINELDYHAVKGAVVPQVGMIAAGVGELGRNGLVITKDFGPCAVPASIISTDLPLVADKPLDIGVEDFCKVCRKSAVTCPTNSITFEDKVVWNGVEKYKINWETCYKLRPYVAEHWSDCFTCMAVCPYTKPKAWWRDLAFASLHGTPIPLRPITVRVLKWLDDRIWGKTADRRVQWLSYDSGVKPGETKCTIPGCTASHGQDDHLDGNGVQITKVELSKKPDNSKIGYYAPLKENTNRFAKRG